MGRETVDMLGEAVRILGLDGLDDAGMELAPAFYEQTPVRHLMSQRMLEGVFDVGEQACFVQELNRLKVGEAATELLLRSPGDRLEQGQGHVLPDHRRRLEHAL